MMGVGVLPVASRSLAFTAEEKGLLGSRAFAEHPTVDKAALVADVNMDMPLPLWPLKHLGVYGGEESTLGATAKSVAAAMMQRRILINRTSETVLRFLPPYILGKSHVDLAIAALDDILHQHAPAKTGADAPKGGTQIGR